MTIITKRQMATHFARWTISPRPPISSNLDEDSLRFANPLPEHRRPRFMASRTLLAELLFKLYGIQKLPKIVTTVTGRHHFADRSLSDFSIAYAGNSVGVAVTTEGLCGLDMALRPFGRMTAQKSAATFSSSEATWINNQNDPFEARTQLLTLRQSLCKLTGSDD